jgi:hypothetical protein
LKQSEEKKMMKRKKNARMWADNLLYSIVCVSFSFPIKNSCYVPDFFEERRDCL